MQSNNTSWNHWKTGRGSNGNLGVKTKMLLQLLEHMGACVAGEKPEAKRVQEWQCFLWDRSLTRYSGWQAVQVYWLLPQRGGTGREKSQPSVITAPSWIGPIPSVLFFEPVWGDMSLPGPLLVLRDFLFVENSTDKLYNDKWWPKHHGSVPSLDLKLSCN